jgi:molybdopterin converting factor small subunit
MPESKADGCVEVRVFGALRKYLDRRNIPYFIKKHMTADDLTPMDIAGELDLPPGEIEGVFVNGKICAMDLPLSQGDRVAFLPYGTPGPYRVFLGIVKKEN